MTKEQMIKGIEALNREVPGARFDVSNGGLRVAARLGKPGEPAQQYIATVTAGKFAGVNVTVDCAGEAAEWFARRVSVAFAGEAVTLCRELVPALAQ